LLCRFAPRYDYEFKSAVLRFGDSSLTLGMTDLSVLQGEEEVVRISEPPPLHLPKKDELSFRMNPAQREK